jgi:hypothetical protein
MFVDFKFAYIRQTGTSTHALARIYLGDVTTKDEPDVNRVMQPVTYYRRQEVLEEVVLDFPGETKTKAELEAIMRERLTTAREDTLPIEEQRDA